MSEKTDSNDKHRVVIAGGDYDDIEPAIQTVFGRLELGSWLSSLGGKTVFIKPNMLGLFAPERHATTHPSIVRALVRKFREAGAEVQVGDNCGVGGYGLTKRVAERTGIAEAAEGAFVNVAQDTVVHPFKSRFVESLPVSRAMLEADVLVSVSKMKTHSLTIATGAVKNMFGLVAGAGKGRAHSSAPGAADFGSMLADIHSIRPPDLNIMDAIVAMEGAGPSGGDLRPLGKILASKNAPALDSVMCRIMGVDPAKVHHLAAAERRGLGPAGLDSVEIIGELPGNKPFKLPSTARRFSGAVRFLNRTIFRPISETKLALDRDACRQCGLCVDGCPAGAMQMMDKYPAVDETKCIRCFCCQELCPETAWSASNLMSRLLFTRR